VSNEQEELCTLIGTTPDAHLRQGKNDDGVDRDEPGSLHFLIQKASIDGPCPNCERLALGL
jgi:hypothetical protein